MDLEYRDIFGADPGRGRGINSRGDILQATIDGQNFDALWQEFQDTLRIINDSRTAVASLFTFDTTLAADQVAQVDDADGFELQSEFGVPKAYRPSVAPLLLGFDYKDYDLAARYTQRFLRDAPTNQIRAVHTGALAAADKLIFQKTMQALTTDTAGARPLNPEGITIYDLWDGSAGEVPPPYAGQDFEPTHNHYLTTGSADLDGQDLADLTRTITEHGYATRSNERVIIMVHPNQGEVIRGFRVGDTSPFDFIPTSDAPAYLTTEHVAGTLPPSEFAGLPIFGSYGNALLSESYYVPSGYLIAAATSGGNSSRNPLAYRQHVRRNLHGVRLVEGGNVAWPIKDSVYNLGFGLGVRNRGAAAVLQIKATGSYDSPSW